MSVNDTNETNEGANLGTKSQEEMNSVQAIEQTKGIETELEEEKKKSSELSKRLLYFQADIINMQRQAERKEAQAREDVTLKYVLELVSIQEDLERALSVAGNDASRSLCDGLSMLLSKIGADLRAESVERINVALGSDFNPRLHEAVAYTETERIKEGSILSLVRNGYTCKGKVIKPALVEVARQKPLPGGQTQLHQAHQQIEVGTNSGEEVSAESP